MPNENEGNNPTSDPETDSQAASPSSPTVPAPPEKQISRTDEQNKAAKNEVAAATKRELHTLEKINIFGQLGLVIVGTIAASIYGCQLHTMNQTYTEIRDQTAAAQRSAYMSCLSAKSAQLNLLEAKKSTEFARSMALSSANQAAAEIGSEGAVITFSPKMPMPGDFFNNQLQIPVSFQNDGKAAANDLDISYKAVLIRENDVFSPDQKDMSKVAEGRLDAGGEIPYTKAGVHAPTMILAVKDVRGNIVDAGSKDSQDFLSGANLGATAVFIFGNWQYSDFSGKHRIRYCNALRVIPVGTSRIGGSTANEKACTKYNNSTYEPSNPLSVPSASNREDAMTPIVCVAPKN